MEWEFVPGSKNIFPTSHIAQNYISHSLKGQIVFLTKRYQGKYFYNPKAGTKLLSHRGKDWQIWLHKLLNKIRHHGWRKKANVKIYKVCEIYKISIYKYIQKIRKEWLCGNKITNTTIEKNGQWAKIDISQKKKCKLWTFGNAQLLSINRIQIKTTKSFFFIHHFGKN